MTKNKSRYHDRPIQSSVEDVFHIKERIVKRIYSFLSQKDLHPMTVAITGEWGAGKSSVVNLLLEELEKETENKIIYFEPLLEGKLNVLEIIEMFYLLLYKKFQESDIKKIILKSAKSMALLARCKAAISGTIPCVGKIQIEKDFGNDIDDLFKLWGEQEIKTFCEQAQAINGLLRQKGYKLYVVIDEIDRLPSDKILNILMFSRILEVFDDLVCIVGMDYCQIINKLIKENSLGLCEYDDAKAYLDKLFQVKFNVHINGEELTKFVIDRITEGGCLPTIESYNPLFGEEVSEICKFLSTPRQIKKWLISVMYNYPLFEGAMNKVALLKFLAATTKHPVLTDNLSKHALAILVNKENIQFFKKYFHEVSFKMLGCENEKIIYLAALGIKNPSVVENKLASEILACVTSSPIEDTTAENFVLAFLEIPHFLITLFVEGYFDDTLIAAYRDFFSGQIDKVLEELSKDSAVADGLASDIAKEIANFNKTIQNKASIELLNNLWRQKASSGFWNSYSTIIFFVLAGYGSLQDIISNADLSLSEALIAKILREFGIKNKDGEYNIEDFGEGNGANSVFSQLVPHKNKDSVQKMLQQWLTKVSNEIEDISTKWFKQTGLISVFYRFIQFGKIFKKDNTNSLSLAIVKLFEDTEVPKDEKKVIAELITMECERYLSLRLRKDMDPMEILFKYDDGIIKGIHDLASDECELKNIDSFNKIIAEKSELEADG